MKQLLRSLFAILLLANALWATTISGTITTPNTAVPLRNGTLTFALNQAGVIVGSSALTASPVSCYTSFNGAVVGMPDPQVAPSASTNLISGSIGAGSYYVRIVYYNTASMVTTATLPSPSFAVVLSGTGSILVAAPALQPSNATGYRVYLGTVSGSEKLQATTAGFGSTTLTTYNSGGASTPTTNDTVCTLAGNDTIIPSYTTYRTSLVNSVGSNVPGWPQNWYIFGTTLDVSSNYPIAVNVQTRFAMPLVANPSSNAQQSLNSPLTLNGYDIKPGALVLSGLASHALSNSGQAVLYMDTDDNIPYVSINGGGFVAAFGSGSSSGWTDGGGNIYTNTFTDRVMVGLGSSAGDFSNSAFDGSLIANACVYGASGVTNPSVAVLCYVAGDGVVTTGAGIAGMGTYVPFTVKTNNTERTRWDTSGHLLNGLTSTNASVETASILSAGGIYVASASGDNASLAGLIYDLSSGTMRLASGGIGTGVLKPIAIVEYNDVTAAYQEVARFPRVVDLAGTGRQFNFDIGGTAADATDYAYPLMVKRGQNTATSVLAWNSTTGTAAYAGFRALAEGGASDPDVTFGVTSSTFTTANGVPALAAFIAPNANATAGLYLQANAGSVKILNGATVEATFGAGAPVFTTALAQASGGTGQGTAITNTRVVFSDGTSYQGDSGLTFNSTANYLTTVRYIAASGAQTTPAADSGSVQIYYNSSGDLGALYSASNDGAGSGTGKQMLYGASEHIFLIGSPSTLAGKFGVTSNGPKWYVAAATAGSNAATMINLPGSTTGVQDGWLQIETSTGAIAFIPMWLQ